MAPMIAAASGLGNPAATAACSARLAQRAQSSAPSPSGWYRRSGNAPARDRKFIPVILSRPMASSSVIANGAWSVTVANRSGASRRANRISTSGPNLPDRATRTGPMRANSPVCAAHNKSSAPAKSPTRSCPCCSNSPTHKTRPNERGVVDWQPIAIGCRDRPLSRFHSRLPPNSRHPRCRLRNECRIGSKVDDTLASAAARGADHRGRPARRDRTEETRIESGRLFVAQAPATPASWVSFIGEFTNPTVGLPRLVGQSCGAVIFRAVTTDDTPPPSARWR